MASLMENLLDVLKQENEEYEHLIELSLQKKQVIIEGNVPKLEVITDLEHDVTSKIKNLENPKYKWFFSKKK